MAPTLSQIPKYLAVASSVVLLSTVLHEYGYFSIAGYEYLTLFSTTDYFHNAIVLLPAVAAQSISVIFLLVFIDPELEKNTNSKIEYALYKLDAGLRRAIPVLSILTFDSNRPFAKEIRRLINVWRRYSVAVALVSAAIFFLYFDLTFMPPNTYAVTLLSVSPIWMFLSLRIIIRRNWSEINS